MPEIIELKINFVVMTDGKEYIRAGVYDLPITKENLPILVEVAERIKVLFDGRRFL